MIRTLRYRLLITNLMIACGNSRLVSMWRAFVVMPICGRARLMP
jgi:hypothetical protein